MAERRWLLRRLVDALSGRPGSGWPDGFVHHGTRLALLVLTAVLVQLLFPVAPVPDAPIMERGTVPDEDVIAQSEFVVPKSDAELARDRQEAAASVPPIFEYNAAAADSMWAAVDRFFARIDTAASGADNDVAERARIREILGMYGLPTEPEDVELVRSGSRREQLRRALQSAIRVELQDEIFSVADLEDAGGQQLRVRRDAEERLLSRDSAQVQQDFLERAARHLGGPDPDLSEFQRLLLIRFFVPSARYNPVATDAMRERARSAVPTAKDRVLRGQRIVAAHEPIEDDAVERLRAYQRHLFEIGQLDEAGPGPGRATGAFLFNLTILSLFGLLIFYYRPDVYYDFRHITLVAFLVATLVGAAAVIAQYDVRPTLIPIAFPALVIAALWDGRFALNMALIMAVLLSGQTPFVGVTVLTTLVMGGAAASLSVRVVRRRAQTWGFIVIIAGAYALAALTLGLLRASDMSAILGTMGWGTLNAVASAFAAMGFLPLFEAYTRITTDQTLLELADANRPLLRRLSREAPGTYAHSINVANLSEAAADAIGANSLLARVGIYYHDVGKMVKPQYFIENQPHGRNPHDKLKPATSASIVRQHVVEGLRLADEAKLPACVKAFIAEHHGTQPISFFYDRARELDPTADLNPADFAYPGPRPRSKETAIAMLSDSVESAARVLQEPTAERIRALVDRIVAGKIEQGQLDETPLTLSEISRIKDAFVSVLSGMYHQRLDYPSTREETAAPTAPAEREASPSPVGGATGS